MPESSQFIIFSDHTAFVVLCALSAWLGGICANRIARKEDRKVQVQLELIKAELLKTQQMLDGEIQTDLQIHRVQFEKEFQIYVELSQKMNAVRRSLFTLQPNIKPLFENLEKENEHWSPLKKDFLKTWAELRDSLQNYRPFYHENVFIELDKIIDISMDEVVRIKVPLFDDATPHKEVRDMKDKLLEAIKSAESAMRTRISTVKITRN